MENDLAVFLKTGGRDFCDINLILDGKTIPAHKSILSARCTYFQAMFRSFMPPDNSVNVSSRFVIIIMKGRQFVPFEFDFGVRSRLHSLLFSLDIETKFRFS